jgi:hypothetical protein
MTGVIGRTAPKDPVDRWIQASGLKESFVDIGGIGEFSGNERVTWAKHLGFGRVAMADLEPPGHHLWKHYDEETAKAGISGIENFYEINVDDPAIGDKLGQWEMVHSTGILYHVPNPIYTLRNYVNATKSDLILNTVTVPEKISSEEGTITLPSCGVLFLPALSDPERSILRGYYKKKFGWSIDDVAPSNEVQSSAMMPYLSKDGGLSYYPYWWLFTVHAFEGALRMLGMKVMERWTWEDHAHFVWLRRI